MTAPLLLLGAMMGTLALVLAWWWTNRERWRLIAWCDSKGLCSECLKPRREGRTLEAVNVGELRRALELKATLEEIGRRQTRIGVLAEHIAAVERARNVDRARRGLPCETKREERAASRELALDSVIRLLLAAETLEQERHARQVAEATLAGVRDARTKIEDCGQDGVCKLSPGCNRHWEERSRELVRENEVLRSNCNHLSSENASLSGQLDSMAMRIESLAEQLAKPEDVRLREVIDELDGRAVMFDSLAGRVGAILDELDEFIARAGSAERTVDDQKKLLVSAQSIERELRRQLADVSALSEERLAHAHQLQADIEAEQQGRLVWRKRFGARDDETMGTFLERLATMAGVVPVDVHECGWQWRPTAKDTAYAPPFGTIRACRVCGCLVAGGPTACVRCADGIA